ncbi:MAG: KEOPS complex subunit Cgi121 [Thermoplasmatota archaeon]
MIEIRGYVGDIADLKLLLANVDEISARFKCDVQLARADRILDRAHLERAASLAERAFSEGRNSANAFGLETLRYAAGERQISKALERLGLRAARSSPSRVAALARGARAGEALDALAVSLDWRRDDTVLENDVVSVLDALGVSAAERAAIPRERWPLLVMERVALVDLFH